MACDSPVGSFGRALGCCSLGVPCSDWPLCGSVCPCEELARGDDNCPGSLTGDEVGVGCPIGLEGGAVFFGGLDGEEEAVNRDMMNTPSEASPVG